VSSSAEAPGGAQPSRTADARQRQSIRVPATRVNDIVNGKRGITADTALRLARYFGNSPES
jgi:addiction module HigA family antidote